MKKIHTRKFRQREGIYFKILIGIVLVILGGYFSINVSAGSNDTTIVKTRIDNIYALTNLGGQDRVFNFDMYRMNGRIVYCIDLGVDITTSIYNSTGDFGESSLSKEQINYIRGISYFGYEYPGHEDQRFYMAAQELIWEYLSGVDVRWTNDINSRNIMDIDSYKQEILNLKLNYDMGIRLDYNDEYSIGDRIIINNNMLEGYDIVSSKYSSSKIEGNNLIIDVGNNIGRESIKLRKRGVYSYDSLLYYSGNSQRLISNGNYINDTVEVSFNISGATLGVALTGSREINTSFEGSTYELYDSDNRLVGTYIADENGKFSVDELRYGTYYLKQIKAGLGYSINKKITTVVIDKNDNSLELEQYLIENWIRITKVYGSSGNYRPEREVVFHIYNSEGRAICLAKTNNAGMIDFRLKYGTYRVHQITTTPGYSKVEDFMIEVTEELGETRYYNLVNELILANVRISTLELNSKESINSDKFVYKILKEGENTYLDIDGKSEFYTDSNGKVLIPINIPYGDYVIEQIDSDKGIILNKEKYKFSIDGNSNLVLEDGKLILDVDIYNEFATGRINIKSLEEKFKTNENEYHDDIIPRESGSFTLIAADDIIVNDKIVYKDNDEIGVWEVDSKGEVVINNINLGNYCLRDNDTLEEKCFSILSNNNINKIIDYDIEFTKKLKRSNITINNIDSEGKGIAGTIFEVIDKGDKVIYTGSTDEDGNLKIKELLNGDYCFRERSVSNKYEINKEKMCFVVDSDRKIEFINKERTNKRVIVPNTLSNRDNLYLLFILTILIGVIYCVYKKIFKSKLYR